PHLLAHDLPRWWDREVVAHGEVDLPQHQVAGPDLVAAAGPGQDLLRHGHAHGSSQSPRRRRTALPASEVESEPPRSGVHSPARIAPITASSILPAAPGSPRCETIIAPVSIAPRGLTIPFPAIFGALPWTGSKRPL